MTRARETSENARLAKAWVNFDGTFGSSPFTLANGGIRSAFNVSSVTDIGVGYYTINFTSAMPDADYSLVCTSEGVFNGSLTSIGHGDADNTGLSTGSARIESRGGVGSGAPLDSSICCVVVFR